MSEGRGPLERGRPFRAIWHFARPYRRDYAIGGALALVFSFVGLAVPVIISQVVKHLDQGAMTRRDLALYFVLLIGVSAVTGVASWWQRTLMIGASRKVEYDLRNAYFRHVQRLSQDFFHRMKTGDVMARATNDLNYVRMFVGPGVMGSVTLVQLPYTLGLMVYFSPILTMYALLPLPLVSVLVYWFVMYIHRQSDIVQGQFASLNSRAQEALAGARVVKAYGIEERELRDFRLASATYMKARMRLAVVEALAFPLIAFVVGMMLLFVLWRGGAMVIDGRLNLENFVGAIVCLTMLVWPLAELGWITTLYQRGSVGMKRILEVMTETPGIADSADTDTTIGELKGAIRFEKVSFDYGHGPVLHEVDFAVEEGQTVAIVGPTGAGKSTVVALLTREYDPTSGRVVVDGHDIRTVPLTVLRRAIGYVPQDTFLFSDTVGNNLALGRPDAGIDEMNFASDVAQFTETLQRLDHGYATLLGERGVNLSGGQKQRLAIARAVLRDPAILILDDALSSVDTQTEERILQRLRQVASQRTTVLISHRISTIRHADLILVLCDGRIVERGRHEELVAAGGLYEELYQRQLLEEELEETA